MTNENTARQTIIEACRKLTALGLTQGTSGNISVRYKDRMLITPSAVPYEQMRPGMIASLDLSGAEPQVWDGPMRPSSEWRFHWLCMKQRPDVTAVVHGHPPYCTALAILRKEIPPCHYMIATFGGSNVRCAEYALFGSMELAKNVVRALEGRHACLLANHGMVATGQGLDQAMWRAAELEALARQYHLASQMGAPVLLSEAELEEALARFSGYGVQGSR